MSAVEHKLTSSSNQFTVNLAPWAGIKKRKYTYSILDSADFIKNSADGSYLIT